MKHVLLFITFLIPALNGIAQSPNVSSAEILLNIKKLNTVGSVLYIAAHPDDENTRLLTWLSKERKVRTGYLSITRGDGGQNLIGKEQGEPLGVIRTQELLAARRTDGAEQFFTRANDFGFSKNPDETFKFWNRDSILYDVVKVIRTFKPDIIICRFPISGEGGHGHHTASAILALEAFDAAGDPSKFKDQLTSLNTWKAKRILWNTFNFGSGNTTAPNQLKIDVGGYNKLLGKSYGEISAESRSMHKSQGFGSARSRGSQLEYFKHMNGDSATTDLFDGINLTWNRIKGGTSIEKKVNEILKSYLAESPEMSVESLLQLRELLKGLDDKDEISAYWKKKKLEETESLILLSSGIWLEVNASEKLLTPGQNAEFTASVISRSGFTATLEKIEWFNGDTITNLSLKDNNLYAFKSRRTVDTNTPLSNPYWLNEAHEVGSYVIRDRSMLTLPESKAFLSVTFYLDLNGKKLVVRKPVVYKTTDPVKGELYKPVFIFPPATINLGEKAYLFNGNGARTIVATIKAHTAKVDGVLEIESPAGWNVPVKQFPFSLVSKGEEKILVFLCQPDGGQHGQLQCRLIINGVKYSYSLKDIEYDHIPEQSILSPAKAELVMVDIKNNAKHIGYIPGAGDDVAQSLRQAGFDVIILNDELLTAGKLDEYDAIVTGVRAYNTNDRLQVHYERLMKYVENGGNLIVQYNTNNRIGPLVAKISPYPLNISRDRVTDEKAEVRILLPDHPVFNTPNKIGPSDFTNWIQERGIYFASDISPDYITPLSMNDHGEKAHQGSLLIAKHGKGNFVYTGLVFFRQLPAGNPGAFRLFANLLSLPENN